MRDDATEANSPTDERGSLAWRIGRRLRARRKELGRTLSNIADRSGLSVSYLSAVEKGVNLPSLASLVKITDALETTIPVLLAAEGANRVRRGKLPSRAPSAVDLSHKDLQLRAVAIRSGPGETSQLSLPTKDHDIFCYVVEGELEVVLDEGPAVTLRPGDALDARSVPAVSWSTRSGALAVWTACPVRI
jgi:transcriptional regulator with XRE-family HTH domain